MNRGEVLVVQKGDDMMGYYFEFYEVLRRKEGKVEVVMVEKLERPVHGKAGYKEIKPIPKRVGQVLTRKVMYDKNNNTNYIFIDSARAYKWDGRNIIMDKYHRGYIEQ